MSQPTSKRTDHPDDKADNIPPRPAASSSPIGTAPREIPPADRGGRIDFEEAEDLVEEASEESFPASDSPAISPAPVKRN